jgi:hypothetical protein
MFIFLAFTPTIPYMDAGLLEDLDERFTLMIKTMAERTG